MNLQNKIIVITGASKGIGKALADSLSQKGAHVVASDYADTDVRSEAAVQTLAERTIKEFGRIDIWINNAGVFYNFSISDEFVNMEKAHQIMDTNFFGTVFGCRTALNYMKKEGNGTIINISSSAALDATRATNAKIYAASKWALRGYTQALKGENADSGIAIYTVYPGGTQTALYGDMKPANFDEYMTAESVAQKIVENMEKNTPEEELVIKRPTA